MRYLRTLMLAAILALFATSMGCFLESDDDEGGVCQGVENQFIEVSPQNCEGERADLRPNGRCYCHGFGEGKVDQ